MRQIDGRLVDGRLIDAESTGGAVLGLRVAIGAGLLALGWLVLGSVAGSASATELDIGDGSLLGPGSSLVTEPIALSDVVTDAAAVPKLTEPVSQNVRPVLESVTPALEPVQPVLEPVLDAIQPVLQSVEPVLNTVGVDPTVFGTLPESILAPPERVPAAHCVTGCDGPRPSFPQTCRATSGPPLIGRPPPLRRRIRCDTRPLHPRRRRPWLSLSCLRLVHQAASPWRATSPSEAGSLVRQAHPPHCRGMTSRRPPRKLRFRLNS